MIYVGYALAALWAVGCVFGPLYAAYRLFLDESPVEAWACLLLAFPIGCLLAAVPVEALLEADSPDLVTLKKHEWFCSAAHSRTSVVMSGKTPIVTTTKVCDQYNRSEL